ncbi:glycosyltransferase family 58 protein [Lutibacter citreus]|uniref:mannosyltransferase n=1 Tax=Lutibacter citreus TaxID=2138210 RepID=UPI000DBE2EA2|nr:mannosyltransferase [Lutibacter citreus]
MLNWLKEQKLSIVLTIIGILGYLLFAYKIVRTDYSELIVLYTVLFLVSFYLLKLNKNNLSYLIVISIVFRFLFLFAIPNLSQDFYRFIWDGRMILEGFNPYLFTPESFIIKGEFPIAQAKELYAGMGSLNGSHFTNYPPINQLCFAIAGLFAGKSILGSALVMRLLIIFADVGILYFGIKLLKNLKLPVYSIFFYILNPFIIIELTGNLHFEAVMLFFVIWSLYLLHKQKWKLAAVVFALSISVKLIPLIFLPLFFQKLGFKKSALFYGIVGLVNIALFAPFISLEFIINYTKTVGLWFQNFEFNASVYYIAREIGYLFRGYNEIAIIGKILPVIVIVFILIVTFFRKNKTIVEIITAMLFVLSFYYFTSTTVHPWYIATLLLLSVFTKYKFPLVWSFIIIISYLAYANSENKENLWIISFEYLIVYSVLFYELIKHKRKQRHLLF